MTHKVPHFYASDFILHIICIYLWKGICSNNKIGMANFSKTAEFFFSFENHLREKNIQKMAANISISMEYEAVVDSTIEL